MDGIIALYKEPGMTSHDCVFKLRKILKTKKVGHTGTLDPAVAGVLPICIGRATKLAEYLTDEGKEYVAEITLGTSTETEDQTGEVVAEKAISAQIEEAELEAVLQRLTGDITQTPPMYSAVKVNGRKLYEYARAGETVERPKRIVTINELKRLDSGALTQDNPSFKLRIRCGKGTYIRTLAVMIGEALGYPAHMSALERTKSGFFSVENCATLSDIEEKVLANKFDFLHPLELGVSNMPQIALSSELYERVLNGAVLDQTELFSGDVDAKPDIAALLFHEKLTAIYRPHPNKPGKWKPEKVIELRET
ncbi:tRNA pseudouridine synthase B [Listeria floridensis FSL S10-1187]|uniref:tRNA pseudouridine synthase B n=1 Tax=Listeria floridensis FSL S10-1187 TaxID=1265817 RepID=A0ABP3AXW0_9LIST|nr:tRNA pseudouridine(55) synthase TruB [Listeria floridensis]EUJ31754.1 tRNA pseudouridine synthase B [Listeria floridensis FSL S10-1187]